jgi:Tfp pilus assembly ATPase PilU
MKKVTKKIDTKLDVSLGRLMSTGNNSRWVLEITDSKSRLLVAEIELNNDQIADLISARDTGPCKGTIYQSPHHGLKHENKTVNVYCKASEVNMEDMINTAQAEEDKTGEGWVFDSEKSFNRHRYNTEDQTYTLIARRWV